MHVFLGRWKWSQMISHWRQANLILEIITHCDEEVSEIDLNVL